MSKDVPEFKWPQYGSARGGKLMTAVLATVRSHRDARGVTMNSIFDLVNDLKSRGTIDEFDILDAVAIMAIYIGHLEETGVIEKIDPEVYW